MGKQICCRFIYKCEWICNDPDQLEKTSEMTRDASWKLSCDIISERKMNDKDIIYIEKVLRDKIRQKYFIRNQDSCSYLLVNLISIQNLDINIVNIKEVENIKELAFRNLHFKEIEE